MLTNKATFTLCPSPCPYQSPCPNSHFLIKLEAVFRLHQFPYQSPIQCHQISVRSVSIGPPTVKNWYGRPFLSACIRILQVPIQNHTLTSGEAVVDIKLSRKLTGILIQCKRCDGHGNWSGHWNWFWHGHSVNVPLRCTKHNFISVHHWFMTGSLYGVLIYIMNDDI